MNTAVNVRTGMEIIRTAGINVAGEAAATLEEEDAETTTAEIMMEMMAAENAPLMGTRSTATIGRVASSTHTVVTSMQTKRKNSSMRRPTGPTRSTRTCITTALREMGVDVIMGRDADFRAVAVAAVAEEDTTGDVVFKAAGVGAEGGTRIKGTTSKEISRGTIIKEIINCKATSTITVIITDKVEATDRDLPRDKVNRIFVNRTVVLGVIRTPRGIISKRNRSGLAHRAI